MSRRPRRDRPPRLPDRPPRLPDRPPATAAPLRAVVPSPTQLLVAAHVAGTHARLGPAEVAHAVDRLVRGVPDARLGLDLAAVTRDEGWAALAERWGATPDRSRPWIDPACTVRAVVDAAARLRAVGARGGRVALATGRPASLLALLGAFGAYAAEHGAEVVTVDRFGDFGPGRRSLWWHEGVAVVTDGRSLLADDGVEAGPEWLFAVGRPDLVVADGGFAGAAVRAGHETLALADLDAPALGVAAGRGMPARVVPLQDARPPAAYEPLVGLLGPAIGEAGGGPRGDEPPVPAQGPHSTTRAPGTYAHPTSGGEG